MKHSPRLPLIILAMAGAFAFAQKPAKQEDIDKVKAVLPSEAPAKPKSKHEILIFSKTNGFRHSSIELGTEAFKLMGEKTGAFHADSTEDDSAFEPENLKKYDAVVFLSTTGEVFRPKAVKDAPPMTPEEKKAADEREERLKKSLVDFVKSGKGLIGIHSATDTYHGWKEYHDMMGGTFSNHPWHELVGVKNTDASNALNKAFEGKDFTITDEIYQWKPGTFSTENHRVLLALDNANTKMDKKNTNGPDALYPMSIVRKYGEGRVFYCSLGHREEIYWNPKMLQHYLAGIQFALGDLQAEAAPANLPNNPGTPQ